MEGESLFNDATSIVLFEIFFEMVKKLGEGSATMEGGLLQEGLHIILQIGWLAVGDFFFFLLLLLLPPPSSSSSSFFLLLHFFSLPCWRIGVQLANRELDSGEAELCKRLHTLSFRSAALWRNAAHLWWTILNPRLCFWHRCLD